MQLYESHRCSSVLKYRSPHAVEHLDLALETIGKLDPQHTVPRSLNLRDVWSETDHCNGSIGRSVSPQRTTLSSETPSVLVSSSYARNSSLRVPMARNTWLSFSAARAPGLSDRP